MPAVPRRPARALRLADLVSPEPVQRVRAEPRERRVIPRLGGRHGVGRAVHELERRERRDRALCRQRTRRAQLLQEPGLQDPALVLLPQRARTRRLGLLRLQTRYADVSVATPLSHLGTVYTGRSASTCAMKTPRYARAPRAVILSQNVTF